MKPEIKQKWLSALRSGNYSQGHGNLRSTSGDSFCCLGVLCDLAKTEDIGDWVYSEGEYFFVSTGDTRNPSNVFNSESSSLTLPLFVQKWAGLDSENPDVDTSAWGRHDGDCLAEANDWGLDFESIADIIDEQL